MFWSGGNLVRPLACKAGSLFFSKTAAMRVSLLFSLDVYGSYVCLLLWPFFKQIGQGREVVEGDPL